MQFVDLHEDFGITSSSENVFADTVQNNLHKVEDINDILIFSAIFPFRGTWARNSTDSTHGRIEKSMIPDPSALFHQAGFYSYLSRTGRVRILKDSSQIDLEVPRFLISMEGCDVMADFSDSYLLYDMGIRCLGFTWNYDNKYAASCYSKRDYGLTGSGTELVNACNELGMIVDMAHASEKATIESAEVSSGPVIITHTNVSSLFSHERNVSDAAIEAVANSGGVVGISGIGEMLSGNPDIRDVARNINYIGSRFGWESVAIGTDFLGMNAKTEGFREIQDVERLAQLIEHPDMVMHRNAKRVLHRILK